VRLRLWTPQGARLLFVKQVNPIIDDLTGKAREIAPQIREVRTGSWSAGEARDFHVAVEVRPGQVGDEVLALRPSVVYLRATPAGGWAEIEDKAPAGRVLATWTNDASLSARLDDHVAHYTGQGELAAAIQQGLEARERGMDARATQLLGRAVKLAHTLHDAAMTQRLAKVVDVVDPGNGTVRLKKDAKKAATMDLALESRTTQRVAKRPPGE
jgi:hypothetical protein